MSSGKKPEQIDLFAPKPAPAPAPAPAPVPVPVPVPVPAPVFDEPWFPEEEPPPIELLDAPQQAPAAKQQARVYQVAEVVRLASRTLESRWGDVVVEGEISNLKTPNHCYFTLKDAEAQLPAVMFRTAAMRLKFRLTDGLQVRARGRLAIYDAQGKFQMYVEQLEPAGLGALQLAFEQLKKKLAAEGLFDEARKRRLPFWPRRIGVATSATGAAVRDIVRVATRRAPARLLLAPCLVQGDGAPLDIVRAIAALERQPDVDVIIVGRGGGSAEDLWAFNDERVARAIARCRVPVISAVGHEVDFTIADFVADRRAATPSQAAELAVPVWDDLAHRVDDLRARLGRAGARRIGDARLRLDNEVARAAALLRRSMDARRRALAQAGERLGGQHPRARLGRNRAALDELSRRLHRPLPDRVARAHKATAALRARLDAAMQQAMLRRHRGFEAACGKLDALSPLKVLERGYGIVRDAEGHVVTSAEQVNANDQIQIRLARGTIDAVVGDGKKRDGD